MPNMIVPSGLIGYIPPGTYNIHPHSPGFGGEITWNDIQVIKVLNGLIKQQNKEIAQQHGVELEALEAIYETAAEDVAGLSDADKLLYQWSRQLVPYIMPMDPDWFPSAGYHLHDHVNEYNGGQIIGAGNHDHRGVGYQGYAFSCYHPGTSIPLRTLRLDI